MLSEAAAGQVRPERARTPYTLPSTCERRGALASAPPSCLLQHARMHSIPGPNPPTKARLARLVHRMALPRGERGLGPELRMLLIASLVVLMFASCFRGVRLVLRALASLSDAYYVPSMCASDVCSFV